MAIETKRGCGYRKIGGTYLEADNGMTPIKPAIFCLFKPERIEKIFAQGTLTDKERQKLEKQNITVVEVPGNDPDHQG